MQANKKGQDALCYTYSAFQVIELHHSLFTIAHVSRGLDP